VPEVVEARRAGQRDLNSRPLDPAMPPYFRHQVTLFPHVNPRTSEQDRAAERHHERWWLPLRSQHRRPAPHFQTCRDPPRSPTGPPNRAPRCGCHTPGPLGGDLFELRFTCEGTGRRVTYYLDVPRKPITLTTFTAAAGSSQDEESPAGRSGNEEALMAGITLNELRPSIPRRIARNMTAPTPPPHWPAS
jgi:hypothetical protein